MDNPNAYDDDRNTRAAVEANTWVQAMWDSGSSLEEVESALADALTEATGRECSVEIGVAP